MKKNIIVLTFLLVSGMFFINLSSCKKTEIDRLTTSDLNIYPYFQANASQFSEWAKIIDKSGFAGFLTAYGSYTMFAPTNNAVKLYLAEINKNSVDDFTPEEAKKIVSFHLIQDTIPTNLFKDGKIATPTMYGQFLVSGVTNTAGVSSVTINRQAIITQGNILTGNGLIHVLDHVLKPAVKSSAQIISETPELSIFKEALIATGLYDTLNLLNTSNPKRFFTVIAETNQALADAGFANYTALFNKLSNTRNPKNPLDSLYIYVAYHIIPDAQYLSDIASSNSQFTLQPLEVLASKLVVEQVLINELEFNGVLEKGAPLDRSKSDVSTTTGVLHVATSHFRPKTRPPFPVYWDVADFPEIRKLPAFFRKANLDFAYGSIKDITWNNTGNTLAGGGSGYNFSTSSTFPTYWGDYLNIGMGTTSRHNWIEFRTPLLVKGKYNIWICYRQNKNSTGSYVPVQVSFNRVPTARFFEFTTSRPLGADGELLALGWKRYTTDLQQIMSGKFVGAVDVTTTGRHIIRLTAMPASGTGQPNNYLDMIHFIPVDWASQFLPRFGRDGSIVYQ